MNAFLLETTFLLSKRILVFLTTYYRSVLHRYNYYIQIMILILCNLNINQRIHINFCCGSMAVKFKNWREIGTLNKNNNAQDYLVHLSNESMFYFAALYINSLHSSTEKNNLKNVLSLKKIYSVKCTHLILNWWRCKIYNILFKQMKILVIELYLYIILLTKY